MIKYNNMQETINDSVEVSGKFSGGNFTPVYFIWNNREIRIEKINLTYTERTGRSKLYYFSVSDDAGNVYKLQFNSEDLKWILLEIYAE